MKFHGSASAGKNESVANFSRNMTVVWSGSSILSTMTKLFRRALQTPGGGDTILRQLAPTSCASRKPCRPETSRQGRS